MAEEILHAPGHRLAKHPGTKRRFPDEYETNFSNRWEKLHRDRHPAAMALCMEMFLYEYNDVWPPLMDRLEAWIETNNAALEAAKDA